MRVARRHVYHLYPVPGHRVLDDLRLRVPHIPEPYHPAAAHHDELLVLAVVPVVPLRHMRTGDVHRHLAPVGGAEKLSEAPALVAVSHHRIAEPILREV